MITRLNAILLVFCALLAGCGDSGAVRIGYQNEAPYAYLDTETGKVTGEAPEIARVLFARMGITEIEAVPMAFGELIPSLKAGKIDVVAAGMYVTPERCEQVLFSNPTYRIGESFLVGTGNPKSLHGYGDVAAHADAKIGVMGGSVEHGYARALEIPEDRIVVFKDYPTGLVGLEAGRIDALAVTYLTASDLLSKRADGGFERADPFEQPVIDGKEVYGYGAFGFRLDDGERRDAFDAELAKFIGTEEHLALVKPFGFSKETLPGDKTTADLCGE